MFWKSPLRLILPTCRNFFTFRGLEKQAVAQAMSLNERFADVCILTEQMKKLEEWSINLHKKQLLGKRNPAAGSISKQIPFDASQLAFEITSAFKAVDVDCVVGGSLVVMAYTLPQMTKDVDFNINLRSCEPRSLSIIKRVCDENGWEFVKHMMFNPRVKRNSDESNEKSAGLVSIKVKGVWVDLFMNDWAPTAFLHERAVEISFPCVPPVLVRIAPHESIAFFKTLTFTKTKIRWQKVEDNVTQLLRCCHSMDRQWVRDQLVVCQGEDGPSVAVWDEWTKIIDEVYNVSVACCLLACLKKADDFNNFFLCSESMYTFINLGGLKSFP